MICFFQQKTAYGLRISDWSSDVCSADLAADKKVARHLDARRSVRAEHVGAIPRGDFLGRAHLCGEVARNRRASEDALPLGCCRNVGNEDDRRDRKSAV